MTQSLSMVVREIAARLVTAGVPSPEHDAAALVAQVLGWETSAVRTAMARGDDTPAMLDLTALDDMVERRTAREPLQHITGRAAFRTLELQVGPGVFVPRPETELVVQAGIDALAAMPPDQDRRVADLCSGSGAVALTLATETLAQVWAVELSKPAVEYLRRNVSAQPDHVAARVTVVQGDARTALANLNGTLDVIVTNPPYIPNDARPKEPEVDLFDPPVALYGLGADGLEVPRGIVAAAARLLRPGGFLAMEHGAPQAREVRDTVATTGAFTEITTHQDLAGWDRFVTATRLPGPA